MTRSPGEGRSDRIVVNIESDIQDLVPGFLANRRNDVQKILDALGKGDFDAIRIMAHSMKGAGGGYGFETISEIGAAMEQGAKQGNSMEIERWLAELRDYLDRVDVVYV